MLFQGGDGGGSAAASMVPSSRALRGASPDPELSETGVMKAATGGDTAGATGVCRGSPGSAGGHSGCPLWAGRAASETLPRTGNSSQGRDWPCAQ